jgi:squalene-hopene/tetraprenyl-beta-curcumene cyclase
MSGVPHLEESRQRAREYLLSKRVGGHWEGHLSSSALSTATACFALESLPPEVAPPQSSELIRAGHRWLLEHQNTDGGWGDTVLSHSNLSTTVLCWAALAKAGDTAVPVVCRAEGWIRKAAGTLDPGPLSEAIAGRYGKDRTFSVPILTMCALAGRLGPDGWRHVPALPFELAVCPRAWFRRLQLPVVSYALPALIAIGQVGFASRSPANPVLRAARHASRSKTLEVLKQIQPLGGGFLEATPLTSFVTMSLAGCGLADHPVAREGADFLVRSARPDGSWAIDTNLATWVTTLSINALAAGGRPPLPQDEAAVVREWLLKQQYREVHPYTGAAPGGWAWTDLPGGVPDADDTAGALIALHHLGPDSPGVREAAEAGVRWLLDLQNRDGGMPTFCRGWGALPFDRSGADLTAHALGAFSAWYPRFNVPSLRKRLLKGIAGMHRHLDTEQRAEGAWTPLWFGNQDVAAEENPTYGTSRVLLGLASADRAMSYGLHPIANRGLEWLHRAQNTDGGWGGAPEVASSIEETALAVQALATLAPDEPEALARGVAWLIEHTDGGRTFPPSPIGFYFARLWYYEELYAPIFTVGALESASALV